MICTNNNCQKKFAKPLELYNGSIACPHCKTQLSAVPDLTITKHNDELFNLSEVCFLRYLSPESLKTITNKSLIPEQKKLLNRAIEYCSSSAKEGNPKAIYKLAYYNEHYLETVRSETDRMRLAFEYYYAICHYKPTTVTTEDDVKGLSNAELQSLKRQSALSLLKLYYAHPIAFKGKTGFENRKTEVENVYGTADFTSSASSNKNKANHLHGILVSCFDKDRAPLFGLYKINGKEFKDFVTMMSKKSKFRYNFSKLMDKGIEIRYSRADEDGKLGRDSVFYRITNDKIAQELISDLYDKDYLYLYIFNVQGKHQYLSSNQMKQVKKDIAKDDEYTPLIELIDYSNQDYLFYDDDIYFFKKGFNAKGCVEQLIEFVTKEN